MQIYFLQPVFIIFTRGAINSEHDCSTGMRRLKVEITLDST